ncbi:MAG: LytR C-terminal domain-containing protein [Bifidobacteriaceae bacterium]|nr:LytR C-terminal domain-containing protein [Bifidobacteriaceae bacterium]
MAEQKTFYPADEFDNPLPAPVGVHRGRKSLPVRMIPYVITAVSAMILAFLAWVWMAGGLPGTKKDAKSASTSSSQAASSDSSAQSDSAASSSSESSSASASESAASPSAAPSSSSPASSPSSSAPAAPNRAAAVKVYNATGISGLAAAKAKILADSGYTSVTTGNADSTMSSTAVVQYGTAANEAAAKEIGSLLGISSVSLSNSSGDSIVVVIYQ